MRTTTVQRALWATGLCCLLFGTAQADDLIAPPWRGEANTTFQEWDFLTNANPASPTTVSNTYGSPCADISLGWAASGYWETYPPIEGGRIGVWDIGRGIDPDHPDQIGRITLSIPNTSITTPDSYKEVWVQVTYYRDLTDAPDVNVSSAALQSSDSQSVETIPSWGEYWLDSSVWLIEPNPTCETITITGNYNGSMIDQVVVDTICVPEPATIAVLGVGGLCLALRRRR